MLIHLEKLGKSFGEKVVLHDVTASGEREDRIGIVGQNGAGKTTRLKILCFVLSGVTAHNAAGEAITGTYAPPVLRVTEHRLTLAPASVQGTTIRA